MTYDSDGTWIGGYGSGNGNGRRLKATLPVLDVIRMEMGVAFLFDVVADDPGRFFLEHSQTLNPDVVLNVFERFPQTLHHVSYSKKLDYLFINYFIDITNPERSI